MRCCAYELAKKHRVCVALGYCFSPMDIWFRLDVIAMISLLVVVACATAIVECNKARKGLAIPTLSGCALSLRASYDGGTSMPGI